MGRWMTRIVASTGTELEIDGPPTLLPAAAVPGTPPLHKSDRSDERPRPAEWWNAATARLLIDASVARVAAAWNPLPPAARPEAAYRALVPHDRALWAAYAIEDLTAV